MNVENQCGRCGGRSGGWTDYHSGYGNAVLGYHRSIHREVRECQILEAAARQSQVTAWKRGSVRTAGG